MSKSVFLPSARAQILTRRTYNRPLDSAGRVFETWDGTIDRVVSHHRWLWTRAQGGDLETWQEEELAELRWLMLNRKVSMSGRTLWLGGTELVKRREASMFSCSFIEVRTVHDLVDALWLLLQGCGVGFKPASGVLSGFVRKMDVEVVRSERTKDSPRGREHNAESYDPQSRVWTIDVGDSAEAWAKSTGKIVAGKYPARTLRLVLSEVRAAGQRLKGYGWLSSGDHAIAMAYQAVCAIMNQYAGKILSKSAIWDILNWLGTILSSRRSAEIGLIDHGDPEWETIAQRKYPGFDKAGSPHWYRGQSNNTIAFHEKPSKKTLTNFFDMMVANGGSEPGLLNVKAALARAPWFRGVNPCLVGSTQVYVADGRRRVKIEQLAEEGKDVPVFCVDENNQLTVRMLRHPRLTGVGQKIYRVELDNGGHVRVTGGHRFRLRDGSYRAASDLEPGDSLAILTSYLPEQCEGGSYADQYVSLLYQGNQRPYEHRLIGEFFAGRELLDKEHVHHKNENRLDNDPGNLEVLPAAEHLSRHSSEGSNPNAIAASNEDLLLRGRSLSARLGRRFSKLEWQAYARDNGLPLHFSEWRSKSLGSVEAFAKHCGVLEGLDSTEADPRLVRTYHRMLAAGLDAEIVDNVVLVRKKCEVCGDAFSVEHGRREQCVCSHSCGNRYCATDREAWHARLTEAHAERKQTRRRQQVEAWLTVKETLGRDPSKKEWASACRAASVSAEISRTSSPFPSWEALVEAATASANHKVVGVFEDGTEDVYNGTVDDHHNFFVGGWDEGLTEHGRRKIVWLNNMQCGEILLPNHGFCVGGATLLITRDGVTRIDRAVDRATEVWNGKKWSTVKPMVTGVNQKLVRVSFGDGSYLDCTPDHRFSVKNRFDRTYREVQAGDLMEPRYRVHTEPFVIRYEGGEEHPEAYTLGVVVGDGGVYRNPSYYKGYQIELDLYGAKQTLPVLGEKSAPVRKPGYNVDCTPVNGLGRMLDAQLVLSLKEAADGFEALFSWSREAILNFVAGLADADGSETGTGGIRIYVSDFERAGRLQLLLVKCGVRSSVNLMQRKGEETNYGVRSKDQYYLQVTNCGEIPCRRLDVSGGHEPAGKGKHQTVKSVEELPGLHTTYCFNEPEEHKAVFGTSLTYQCNLCEIDLAKFVGDHTGLHQASALIARANYRQTCVNLRDGILQSAWHETNEYLRLCGVGVTGVVRRPDMTAWDYRQLKYAVVSAAYGMADELGMERPKNVSAVKPSGCRPWYALTTTDKGLLTLQEQFVDHPDGAAWAVSRLNARALLDGKTRRISRTFVNGVKPVYRVTMSYGLVVESTGNHPWFVKARKEAHRHGKPLVDVNAWVETEKLRPGDVLELKLGAYDVTAHAELRKVHTTAIRMRGDHSRVSQPAELDRELSWLLGYVWGDGAQSVERYRLRFVDGNEETIRRAAGVIKRYFGLEAEVRRLTDRNAFSFEVGSKVLWLWMQKNGLNKYEIDEEDDLNLIPQVVRRSSRDDVIAFLAGLLDADGSAIVIAGDRKNVVWTTANARFARHLQDVAWAVGLGVGRSLNSVGKNFQHTKEMYLLALGAHVLADAVARLREFSSKASGLDRAEPKLDWNFERTPANKRLAGKVLKVEPAGEMPTFDVEVLEDHWFYAGAVKSHNTLSKCMDTTEGVHKPKGKYIFNNVSFSRHDPLVERLLNANYKVWDHPTDKESILVTLPVSYEDVAFDQVGEHLLDRESAVTQLERYKLLQDNYVDQNTSITVSYEPEEKKSIVAWLDRNWDHVVATAFLFRADPLKTAADLSYAYLPQEVVTRSAFEAYSSELLPVDLDADGCLETEVDERDGCVAGVCPVR